jgi:hypothetical protein
VLTAAGKVIGDSEFPADAAGYAQSAGLTAEEVGTALLRCGFVIDSVIADTQACRHSTAFDHGAQPRGP